MTWQGFLCELTGERVSPADCLACAQAGGGSRGDTLCPWTPALIRGLTQNGKPRGLVAYSATELLGCLRKVRLQEETPFWTQPSALYARFRGQLGHTLLAGCAGEGAVIEERYYADLDGHLLTGQPDAVYPARKLVVDYKTTARLPGTWKVYRCPKCGYALYAGSGALRAKRTCSACDDGVEYTVRELALEESPPRPYGHHVQQLSLYRWLLAQNGIAITTGEIVYLDMSGVLRLRVALTPLEEVAAFLQERLAILTADELPPSIRKDDPEAWQCRYCDVAAACAEAPN